MNLFGRDYFLSGTITNNLLDGLPVNDTFGLESFDDTVVSTYGDINLDMTYTPLCR